MNKSDEEQGVTCNIYAEKVQVTKTLFACGNLDVCNLLLLI